MKGEWYAGTSTRSNMFAILEIHRDDKSIAHVDINEEQLEWLLNSLRLMQEKQQELATEHNQTKLTRDDIERQFSGVKERDWTLDPSVPFIHLGQLFAEQYNDITELRESIVQAVGRDMTEEG